MGIGELDVRQTHTLRLAGGQGGHGAHCSGNRRVPLRAALRLNLLPGNPASPESSVVGMFTFVSARVMTEPVSGKRFRCGEP